MRDGRGENGAFGAGHAVGAGRVLRPSTVTDLLSIDAVRASYAGGECTLRAHTPRDPRSCADTTTTNSAKARRVILRNLALRMELTAHNT